jgi:hypothetical protein
VDATPVPSEQLDALLRATAPLAPFDLSAADRVQLLVPVPQTVYEPGLLEHEEPDPAFQAAPVEAQTRRAEWLHRRDDVRAKGSAIVKAIAGTAPEYPALADDPDALEKNEQVGAGELDPPEEAYQTTGAAPTLATPFEDLARAARARRGPWRAARRLCPCSRPPSSCPTRSPRRSGPAFSTSPRASSSS